MLLRRRLHMGGPVLGRARCERWEKECGCGSGIGKEFACRGMAFCSRRLIMEYTYVTILQACKQSRTSQFQNTSSRQKKLALRGLIYTFNEIRAYSAEIMHGLLRSLGNHFLLKDSISHLCTSFHSSPNSCTNSTLISFAFSDISLNVLTRTRSACSSLRLCP